MTAMTTNRQAKAKRGVPAGRVLWAAWLVVAVVAPVKAMAQDTPATTDTEIVAQVRFTREQFVDLTTRMLEVADLLDESEPETAQVLRQAVSQARRAFIAEDMERVASLLAQGLTSAAASNQQGVIEELQKVLEMLRAGALDLEERQERINQWRDQLRRLGRILEDQKRLEQQSRVKAHEDEINRQFEELDRQVGSLVEQQQEQFIKQRQREFVQFIREPVKQQPEFLLVLLVQLLKLVLVKLLVVVEQQQQREQLQQQPVVIVVVE